MYTKLTNQTKIIFPLIFFLIVYFPCKSHAYTDIQQNTDQTSTLQKKYNAAYDFVTTHDYWVAPLVDMTTGATICGPWCAALGGILGTIDETIVYFGLADKRYLTWGLFGLTAGRTINNSVTSKIAGVALGVLLPSNKLNNPQELLAPTINAIIGDYEAGTPGMIAGAIIGIIDEINIKTETTDKHYLTFGTIGAATAQLSGYFNPLIANSLGILLGTLAAEYEKQLTDNFVIPIKTGNHLYNTFNKFIPPTQLNDHIEKHAIALVGGQFVLQLLSLKVFNNNDDLSHHLEHLTNTNNQKWKQFHSTAINFAIFLFPYVVGQVISYNVDEYFCKKLRFTLEDNINSALYTEDTMLRLTNDPNTSPLLDNLQSDISTTVNLGSHVLTNAVSSSIDGAYGIGMIIVSSPNIFTYSFLYNQATNWIATYLANQQTGYNEKLLTLSSQHSSNLKHDNKNIRIIAEREGVKFTKDKIQGLVSTIRNLEGEKKIWNIAEAIWSSTTNTFYYASQCYLMGFETANHNLSPKTKYDSIRGSQRANNLLAWSKNNIQSITQLNQAIDRIIILEGKIHLPFNNIDKVNRILHDKSTLQLQDLEISINETRLANIPDLQLDMGKAYAITGESGCGKSSLVSKIKGIKHNGISATGNIYYPQKNGEHPKILMISQSDYFPLDSTLHEIISYPEKIPTDLQRRNEQQNKIKSLLQDFGLIAFHNITITNGNNEDLNTKQNWDELSGGEKKKILIISVIIKQPDILILDEIFNGLDPHSISIVQQTLKKYLPNSLILVIDHHAHDNNYHGFYHKELHIANETIETLEMPAIDT